MTSYLTSVGVQQVSITIANGSATGTATITAVGSGAFIVYQGQTTTDSTTAVSSIARVTLTNSTTVTATRNTSSTDTITVNCAVVDGDTTNLVVSVQFGTVTIASGATTGTASISAVTNANAALFYLGTSTASTLTLTRDFCGLGLSGTTVTATRGLATGADTASFCVVEFQASALASSTQNISVPSAVATTTSTATITSVNVNNTMLAYGGFVPTASTASPARDFPYGQLTNSTTITITFGGNPGNITNVWNCVVVEFVAGVLSHVVQRGTISISASTSATQAISTSPAIHTLCNWLGNKSEKTTADNSVSTCRITQTSDVLLTMSVNSTASPVGSYEIIRFRDSADSSGGADPIWFGMTF